MLFLLFLVGFLCGVLFVICIVLLYIFGVFSKWNNAEPFVAQFMPNKTRIPAELKAFLRSGPDGNGSEWESCYSLSLLLHFLFQEHKDTRNFRRWVYKKLQLELNDVTARNSAAGRIIQGIQIRDLEAGTNSPMVREVRIESFQLAEDDPDFFEELVLIMDLDYRGGFQMSVDALMAFGKFAQLSVKLLNLTGRARFTIKRQPFAHWSFSFVEPPQMELKIDSQFQGRNLRHLIPLINTAFRKALQLKHVWPNYKLRFRPFFQNPLFSPSPNLAAFEHIDLAHTGLEVTVLSSSRINIGPRATAGGGEQQKLFCKVFIEKRPYNAWKKASNSNASVRDSVHVLSVLLAFARKGATESSLGLTFETKEPNGREVRVAKVEAGSNAEKCGFLVGDCLVAVNNIPVRNERQATRLLTGTAGDLLVLVERRMDGVESAAHSGAEDDGKFELPSPATLDSFVLPDIPPMEYRARDASEKRQSTEGTQAGPSSSANAKCATREEGAIEMVVISRRRPTPEGRPHSFSENMPLDTSVAIGQRDNRPPSPTTVRPASSTGTDESISPNKERRRKKRKALKKLLGRTGSFRAAAGRVELRQEEQSPQLQRSRSESELCQLTVPEVLVAPAETVGTLKAPAPIHEVHSELLLDSSSTATTDAAERLSLISTEGDTKETTKQQQLLSSASKRERLHAKANEMAQKWSVSKTRINELFWNKRKPTEFGVEAHDEMGGEETLLMGASGVDSPSKPTQQSHSEKPKKRGTRSKNKSPSPSAGEKPPMKTSNSTESNTSTSPKCTKCVPLDKNSIWGQSLHFALRKESLYLNVLVCAIGTEGGENTPLGWTSIYVPRIVEDCTLTLSNCHRERFHLRGPAENEYVVAPEFEELARHSGFDPRLCFGDLLLGFRFFPNGLPCELSQHSPVKSDEVAVPKAEIANGGEQLQSDLVLPSSSQTPSPGAHSWTQLKHRQGFQFVCGVCAVKIWLKGASQCERCHLVCHNKCMGAAKERECRALDTASSSTFSFNDDAAFEELDSSELLEQGYKKSSSTAPPEEPQTPTTVAPTADTSSVGSSTTSGCRRRRIAEKLQTMQLPRIMKSVSGYTRKRAVGECSAGAAAENVLQAAEKTGSETPESPHSPLGGETPRPLISISEVLERKLLDSFKGFDPEMRFVDLKFEPGNAYNAQVICEAREKGQNVFNWCELEERKRRINEQIDWVKDLVEQSTRERRSMSEKSGNEFEQTENRLQALALIMYLYCSALKDCDEKEEEAKRTSGTGKAAATDNKGEIK